MKSRLNSFLMIAALGLGLVSVFSGCSQSNAKQAKGDTVKSTNCVECATPGSRAALMQQAATNNNPRSRKSHK
tara:strand:- start:716 stop:934 length:219 start_codon:yes stop_codon:yes gene_type:complete